MSIKQQVAKLVTMGQITPPNIINYVNLFKPSLRRYTRVALYKQIAKHLDGISSK